MSWEVCEAGVAEFTAGSEVGLTLGTCLRDLPRRRSVWHAKLDGTGREILLKIYQKHPKQERDLVREWGNSKKLISAGLPLPQPLFRAEYRGDCAVVFDFISGGKTLSHPQLLGDDNTRAKLLKQVAEIHAAAHSHGCYQSDNHLGNYLWGGDRLWLLDAGSYVFAGDSLMEGLRAGNLAMFEASLPLAYAKCFRVALEAHYPQPVCVMKVAGKKALLHRRDAYFKKTLRSCTEFEHLREHGKDWLACRDIDQGLKNEMLNDPDQFFKKQDWLKKGNTCSVVEVEYGGRHYILKRYNRKSLLYRWLHLWSGPRARASWSNGHVLRLFGVATPRPVACMLVKPRLLLNKAYLLMEKVSGMPLGQVAKQQMSELIPRASAGFASRWRELDMLQATHGDMKASNFILDDEGELHLIDLDGLTFHNSRHAQQKGMHKDFRRFMRNWEAHPEIGKVFKASIEVDW